MKLKSKPELILTEGGVPNAPQNDNRLAVFLTVRYSYETSQQEVTFLQNNDLSIFEKVTIMGVDPANPGNDIDLEFSIRPQFTVRPPDIADAVILRNNNYQIDRERKLFVLKSELQKALNVNNLMLNSVKVLVQLIYIHLGESDPKNI